jgi:hypothetical protein
MPAAQRRRTYRVVDLTGEQVAERRWVAADGELIADELEVVVDNGRGEVEVFVDDPGRESLVHRIEDIRIAGEGTAGASTSRVTKRLRRTASPDPHLERANEATQAAVNFDHEISASLGRPAGSGAGWLDRFQAWGVERLRSRRGSKRAIPGSDELDRLREKAERYEPVDNSWRSGTFYEVASKLHVRSGSVLNARYREKKRRFRDPGAEVEGDARRDR